MDVQVIRAQMTRTPETGYVGQVRFRLPGHANDYEITLHSEDGKDWGYSLHFAEESGEEKAILAVEERLEEDDALFDALVAAAMNAL